MSGEMTGAATVGYVSDLVPAELIEAAGLRPLRIGGRGLTATPLVDRIWDSRRRVDADPVADAILEQAYSGDFADLALLIIPHTTKATEGIATAMEAARRDGLPGLPPTHLLDRSYLSGLASSEFNTRQFRALAARLESLGRALTDDTVAEACRAYAELHAVKDALAAVRRSAGLSGSDAVQALIQTWSLPAAEAADRLRGMIAAAPTRPTTPGAGTRVFLAGSAVDTPHWHRAIEERGAIIVAEDDDWGPAPIDGSAQTHGDDPFRALSRRFCEPGPSAVSYPMSTRIQATLDRIERAEPDLVVAVVRRGDGLGIWETPELLQVLTDRGIRAVHLSDQPYVPDADTDLSALDRALTGVTS